MPYPPGFPFITTPISRGSVELTYNGLPSSRDDGSLKDPHIWKVKYNNTVRAALKVDAGVIYDQVPMVYVNADFVIKYLKLSCNLGRPLRVSIEINAANGLHAGWNIQKITLRAADNGKLIRVLERRYIRKVACPACSRWLAPNESAEMGYPAEVAYAFL